MSATVVVTSGHMIDLPDRANPRFPPHLEPVVAARIEEVLDRWSLGPGDEVFSGGARGADILVAESALRRGARVHLHLALPVEEFITASVALPDSVWVQRFRYLIERCDTKVLVNDGTSDFNIYGQLNLWMVAEAEKRCPPANFTMLLVWDEEPSAGEGGTGWFAERASELDAEVAIINPVLLANRR